MTAKVLVTGGSGFIGSALVKALLRAGANVRVLDDNSRGHPRRLADVKDDIEFVAGDIRDAAAVEAACRGIDEVHHLAFVNGTEFFYTQPDLVLDVGVRGMLNVIDACRKHGIGKLDPRLELRGLPDAAAHPDRRERAAHRARRAQPALFLRRRQADQRGAGVNFGRKYFERVLIFRPHNVYGPDMGNEHVIPQLALRLAALGKQQPGGRLRFDIQGTGKETRSFCYIDDLVAGVMVMRDRGEHLGIYHVGTGDEVTIADLVRRIAAYAGREVDIVPGSLQPGGTMRRCPDISKLAARLQAARAARSGLPPTLDWYWRNAAQEAEASGSPLTLKNSLTACYVISEFAMAKVTTSDNGWPRRSCGDIRRNEITLRSPLRRAINFCHLRLVDRARPSTRYFRQRRSFAVSRARTSPEIPVATGRRVSPRARK